MSQCQLAGALNGLAFDPHSSHHPGVAEAPQPRVFPWEGPQPFRLSQLSSDASLQAFQVGSST